MINAGHKRKSNLEAVNRYKARHPDRVKKQKKISREKFKINHPDKYMERLNKLNEWRRLNPGKANEGSKKWKRNNPELVRDYHKKWRKKNVSKTREYGKRWRTKNPDYWKNTNIISSRKKALEMYKVRHPEILAIHHAVGHLLTYAGVGKTSKSRKYIGCSSGFLKNHIEEQFLHGMNWNNYGKVWHIDHIVPLSWFPFDEDHELIYVASHWTNLRPMFAKDNLSKGNRYAA